MKSRSEYSLTVFYGLFPTPSHNRHGHVSLLSAGPDHLERRSLFCDQGIHIRTDDGYYPMILTGDCIECRDRETVPELTIMGRTETAIIPILNT
jgi:hypothetical protein